LRTIWLAADIPIPRERRIPELVFNANWRRLFKDLNQRQPALGPPPRSFGPAASVTPQDFATALVNNTGRLPINVPPDPLARAPPPETTAEEQRAEATRRDYSEREEKLREFL